MFGFFKRSRAPDGPVEINMSIEIERPAADVYALLDWDDPRNSKRQLGHHIERRNGGPGLYRLVMKEMPDLRFDMQVLEAVEGERYAFATEIVPPVGCLLHDEEHYTIEPDGDGRCTLSLRNVSTFQSGLTVRKYAQEVAMMTEASQRALVKFKVHAEKGLGALRELETEM